MLLRGEAVIDRQTDNNIHVFFIVSLLFCFLYEVMVSDNNMMIQQRNGKNNQRNRKNKKLVKGGRVFVIALIAAYAKNRIIGNKGKIPWNIFGEKRRFQELTMGNVLVMGRRTFEEIGKPLAGRDTIVVSTTKRYEEAHCQTSISFLAAIEAAQTIAQGRDIFICGGAKLYEAALPMAERMYITEIDAQFEGDTAFPAFQEKDFLKRIEKRIEGKPCYEYVTYLRKPLH